jgi:Capsule assembly protein Wzi
MVLIKSRWLLACFLGGVLSQVDAGEPWLAPGNTLIRHDVQLLVDSGVIDLPMSAWPIAASDLAHALEKIPETPSVAQAGTGRNKGADSAQELSAAQFAAIARLRSLASEGKATLATEVGVAARPTQLRTFADTPREEGEISLYAAGFFGDRFGGRLQVTGAIDPDDGLPGRLDGSYVAGKFGNWIVTAGQQDRWWGSGWEGSLIMSNNARPVPEIALDRAVSMPFETKWLSWMGPWRLTTFIGRMEGSRDDYAHPVFWGLRVSARPLDGLEISLERTAQLCGEGRSCTWNDFWNMFTGKDNAGENVDPASEPGNQLASWDIRWATPIGDWKYALYNQHTGETIDHQIPRPYRSLDTYGLETWGDNGGGGSAWRAGVEWSNTRCGGTIDGEKIWDCAYNNGIFSPDGYRYYGRVMGHSMDGDGDMYSARYIRVDSAANTLTLLVRYSRINEGGTVPDTQHSFALGAEDWISLDASYRRTLRSGWLEGGVGVDSRDRKWKGDQVVLPRAYVNWNYALR